MEAVWTGTTPQAAFLERLMNQRVDVLINSTTWLKSLRYRYDEVKWWQKRAGHIFKERNLNLFKLIAQSHGEAWDNEDEEKCAQAFEQNIVPPTVNKKPRQEDAVSLDHPCKSSLRQGQKEEL